MEQKFQSVERLISITDIDQCWRVEVHSEVASVLRASDFPLKLQVVRYFGEMLIWEVELNPGTWATWNKPKGTKLQVRTNGGVLLKEVPYSNYKYDECMEDFLSFYVKARNLRNGLVLGAGNGSYGEWLEPVYTEKTNAVLVEPSIADCELLQKMFAKHSGVKILANGVDTVAGRKTFWLSSTGNISSLKKEVSLKYVGEECLTPVEIEFVTVNDIVKAFFTKTLPDWLRIDIEGLDAEVIFSISDEIMRNLQFVQYENLNISESECLSVDNYLKSLGFSVYRIGIDTVAIR
jgi:FkbM family methyltransferase